MITTDNTYTIDVPEIFGKAAKELTDRQRRVAAQPGVQKSGYLASYIGTNYHIDAQENMTALMITYPVYLRYLDMQYRNRPIRKQKKKAPIYNRLVYGFMKGYIYSRLRGGLARYLVEKIQNTKIEI